MNIVWKIGKGVLKLSWALFKMALITVNEGLNAVAASENRKNPRFTPSEAGELMMKGLISSKDYYDAVDPQ